MTFLWKFHNVVMGKRVERHYKCQNTGAWKCKEFKLGGGLKAITYALPDSEDYNIESEEILKSRLTHDSKNIETKK